MIPHDIEPELQKIRASIGLAEERLEHRQRSESYSLRKALMEVIDASALDSTARKRIKESIATVGEPPFV